MKWLSILSLSVLAFFSNACEKHPASALDDHSGHGAAAHQSEAKDAAAHAGPDKKVEDGKPGEAPKFFPEKK